MVEIELEEIKVWLCEVFAKESHVQGPLPHFRADLCKGSSNEVTKLSLALSTLHLHQFTSVHLFNPGPFNIPGLGKGSRMITRKTTRLLVSLITRWVSDKNLWQICFRWRRDRSEGKVKGMALLWQQVLQAKEKERHHISQWSPLLVEQPSPPLPPPCEKQSLLPKSNQVNRTGRSKHVAAVLKPRPL